MLSTNWRGGEGEKESGEEGIEEEKGGGGERGRREYKEEEFGFLSLQAGVGEKKKKRELRQKRTEILAA